MLRGLSKKLFTSSLAFLLALSSFVWLPTSAEAAPSAITINPIPNEVHRISPRFTVTVNGVDAPVIDGKYVTTIIENGVSRQIRPDWLGYDYTTFTATPGETEIVIRSGSKINSISISPLKLGITPTKVDDYTYKFTITDRQYLIISINGSKLVVTRDEPVEYAPVLGAPGVFNVMDYLGSTDSTQQGNMLATASAFQQAVNDASAYGTAIGGIKKGIVYVPPGLYYMGNLMLKSNVALYLDHGSVLRMTDDYSNYNVDFFKASLGSQGRNGTWWIYTENNSSNIKVYGRGTIDGNGHYYQKDKPNSDLGFAAHLLMIHGTSDFMLDGPVMLSAPFWGTVTARSNHVNIRDTKFFNSFDGNENDALDINESQVVRVWDSIGISMDDSFSTKTWTGTGMSSNWYGQPEVLDDVVFNNVIAWTDHGGFKVGHGTYQNQSNITFKNSVIYDSMRAIGIEHVYGTAPVTNVTIDNVDVENAKSQGWFRAIIQDGGFGVGPISNVTIKNINIRHKGSASSLKGYSNAAKISNVTFENIKALGNPETLGSLEEMNITNTGYYEGVTILPDRSQQAVYRIQAENNNGLFGNDWNGNKSIKHVASTDTGGIGYMIGQVANNNYALFRGVNFGAHTSNISIRYDAPRAARVELRLGSTTGTLIGSADLAGNGQWSVWNTYNIPVSGASGTHDLYIVFKVSGSTQTNQLLGNLNWFELTRSF